MNVKKWLVALLSLSVACGAFAQVPYNTVEWPIAYGSLADSHGQKIATGRYNSLHVAYEKGSLIRYATSADGASWTNSIAVNDGASPGEYPAIAVDSYGNVAIVYAANIGANGLGQIWFAHKPFGGSWTKQKIVNSGTQPAIAAKGNQVYITWTTFSTIQYMTFTTTAPPAPINLGEELEADPCPDSGFVKPSIAVVKIPCEPVEVRIAYLRYSDEIGNTDPGCASLETEVGARLCVRDNTSNNWSLEYSNLLTVINNTNGVEPISLSLNANYHKRDVYLAWSDISNNNARTMIAHGKDGAWTDTQYANTMNHIHVAAKNNSNGTFRIARVSDPGGWDPFVHWTEAFYRTGTWSGTGSLSWNEPEQQIHDWGPLIGRPQAHFWTRCSGGNYYQIHFLCEKEVICNAPELATDLEVTTGCPPVGGISVAFPCHAYELYAVERVTPGGNVVVIDGSELGTLVYAEGNEAVFRADEVYVTVSWTQGKVLATSETGVEITNFAGDLRTDARGVDVIWDEQDVTYKNAGKPDVCTIGK